MSGVAVVTDSTSSLSPAEAARGGVTVVPLQVVIDGVSRPETDIDMSGAVVAAALRSGAHVSTSRPTPEAFAARYAELAADGATEIVSVHLSGSVSGTCDAARLAGSSASVPVTVLDSRTLAMAVGFAALSGARRAAAGDPAALVAAEIQRQLDRSVTYFYVDTLEFLRRGGRIGAAQALLGSALAVKPLLTMAGGEVSVRERVRTRAKALARLTELSRAAIGTPSGEDRVDLAVHHLDDPGGAAELVDRLTASASVRGEVVVCEVSAVLGVHTGPGTLGVVVSPRS